MEPLDVGVIGCGTAGAAAALFLARAGHRVTVYEAVAEPGPVGAGITLQPTGMMVLERLGMLGAIVDRGARLERLRCETTAGRLVIDLAYADEDPHAFGLGLHRGALFAQLFAAVRTEPGVTVRLGAHVEDLGREDTRRTCLDAGGATLGAHDLIVVADGARSELRDDAAKLVRRATEYPWGALWFIADDPDGAFDGVLDQRVESTRIMMGLLPSGLGPTGQTKKVSLFWSLRTDRVEAWREAGLAAWKREVLRVSPRAAPVLDQIGAIDEVLFARYWDIVLSPWHAPGVVFLGDAAHATSPQLGQGANLALYDAMVLADELAAAPSLDSALAGYSRARRLHLGYYQWATRFLTPFFQSDARSLGWLRDTFMGLACKLPWVRGKMLRTMCGLERGFVRRSLPMPSLALPAPRG